MPTEEALKKLAEIIKNDQLRTTLLLEIEAVTHRLAKPGTENPLNVQKEYPLFHRVVTELYPNSNNIFNHQQLTELKQQLARLPEVIVETAYSCPELGEWVRAHVAPCGITTSRTTAHPPVAGVRISYQGRYEDMTLNRIIRDKVYG
ncbi:hypothetical protein KJ605_00960 [Patescibacteria group bacterium]|nr:hypothetical protein [Patescibacteria group bacterium]MBU1970335.1 hypothetical protein [Patescibacteria group bacterium]